MTPAVTFAQKKQIDFQLLEYQHDPLAESFGLEAVEKLGLVAKSVFKTLVAELDTGELVVAIVLIRVTAVEWVFMKFLMRHQI